METTGLDLDTKASKIAAEVTDTGDRKMKISQIVSGVTLGIVLFFCGYFLSKLDTVMSKYYTLDKYKAERKEVLLSKEAETLFKLQDNHYRKLFVLQPGAENADTTNYNWLNKGILGGTLRGGEPADNSD